MINYVNGDATNPQVAGAKIIAHVCNDIGGWGRGFVLSVTQRYPAAEWAYRGWYQGNIEPTREDPPFKLGEVQLVRVKPDVFIANMIGQHGVMPEGDVPPIRYDAVEKCLQTLRICAKVLNASVHMPRIGCGLAGGKWTDIEPIIERALTRDDVPTYVYDFNTGDARTIPWQR